MTKIKGKLGLGCMRLPMDGERIDSAKFCEMVDAFIAGGFNYFDTARGYHKGLSETALRECLTSRYPRDAYVLTDKLSGNFFNAEADIRPLFAKQLADCGVEYFDYYLMHAQDKNNYEKYKACRAYETALEFLAEGKIRHFGISFHDNADTLTKILTEYPQIEVVQLQFNYADFEDASVQSRKCYEVCRKFGKDVLIMEPVKGGSLAKLPEEAGRIFDALGTASYASYALRFAAGFEGVISVLSGMGDMDMLRDNMATFSDLKPLDERELGAISRVLGVLRGIDSIPCTACRYCVEGCPANIPIPELFACLNTRRTFHNWNAGYYYQISTQKAGKASDCIECGACEDICPQHLPIRELLGQTAAEFEKKE